MKIVYRKLTRFAIFLEREAGYVCVSLVVIGFGVFLAEPIKRQEMANQLVSFGLGVMARSMGGRRSTPGQGEPTA